MVEKCFKIFSSSNRYLNAESISEALLNYFTLDPTKEDAVFGVTEKCQKEKKLKTQKI